MRPAIALLLIGFAASAFAAQPDAVPELPLAATVRERLANSDDPACVAVALVEQETRFAFGCTGDAPPVALDEHSLFEIGSISKAFTGILLADMVLKGEVSLDDPVSKYSRPGARLPTRGGKEITLRDLATQSAGLPRMPPGFAPADGTNPYADFDPDKLYDALEHTELQSDIGATYLYSNFGFMWLSEMLSRVGGGTYEEVLRKRVLQPLGMKETVIAMDEAQRKRFVDGHDGSGKAVPHWDGHPALAGVGTLRSSAADMAKFAQAVAGLKDTTLKAAIDLAVKPDRFAGGNMIGLAWHLRNAWNGRTLAWHNGGTAGFASMLVVDRDAHRAALVLVNASTRFDDLPLYLMDPNVQMRKKRIAIPLEPALLQEYVGRYERGTAISMALSLREGKLMARRTGQGLPELFAEVFAEAKDRVFLREVDAQGEFVRGKDGHVNAMNLRQGGATIQLPKVSETP